ncbi:anther-specific proline-rich protein APG-like [Histomonas meleagridis]|uniref:anther-specific proline-rich protein APG-like n=1 Tax=Histomonas meleagridis TaxID=135588 RepID=UPI00355A1B46|nr:anther-specific proline-rich protein APG-like [Histomonas meleagridis]KAH0798114.1 anther-specific proline-rich protein APG-like [Histomonas meleagridis]
MPIEITLPPTFPNCEPLVRIPLPPNKSLIKQNFEPNGVLSKGVVSYVPNFTPLAEFILLLTDYFQHHPPVGVGDCKILVDNFKQQTRAQTPPRPNQHPQPNQVPPRPNQYPQPNQTPPRPNQHPQPDQVPPRPNQYPQPNQNPPRPNQHPQPDQVPPRPNQYPQPNQIPPQPNQVPPRPNQHPQPNQVPPRPNQYPQPNQTPPRPNQYPQPNQIPPRPNQYPQPNQIPPRPNQYPQPHQAQPQPAEIPDDYICPVCYEVMKPPNHMPLILFPCGHTLCKTCIQAYQQNSGRKKCCLCNQEFKYTAVNFNLLHIIENKEQQPVQQQIPIVDNGKKLTEKRNQLNLCFEQSAEFARQINITKEKIRSETEILDSLKDDLKTLKEKIKSQKALIEELNKTKKSFEEKEMQLEENIEKLTAKILNLEESANGAQNA